MTALFLSPHHDDECLFGCFHLIRHRPHVVVAFKSVKQERLWGVTAETREAETAAAMEILGCTWEQWDIPDTSEDGDELRDALQERLEEVDARLRPTRVFAPASEPGGHPQHNAVGEAAADIWPEEVVVHYLTYRNGSERSRGVQVPYENEWVAQKLRALACYGSQIRLESTSHHFANWPLTEYIE